MSDNNNTVLIIGGAVLAYMYFQRSAPRAATMPGRPGGVQSMPGNVGSGLQQVATGALSGFLQSLASGPRNNTPQTNFPRSYDPMDQIRGDQVQEGTYQDDYGLIGTGEGEWF